MQRSDIFKRQINPAFCAQNTMKTESKGKDDFTNLDFYKKIFLEKVASFCFWNGLQRMNGERVLFPSCADACFTITPRYKTRLMFKCTSIPLSEPIVIARKCCNCEVFSGNACNQLVHFNRFLAMSAVEHSNFVLL